MMKRMLSVLSLVLLLALPLVGAQKKDYVGYLDHADCYLIYGWAADRNQPDVSITVRIYDGQVLLATVKADRLRPDVGEFLRDNGKHGFVLNTPEALKAGRSHELHVCFSRSEIDLARSCITDL